jgi:hypothetical protein
MVRKGVRMKERIEVDVVDVAWPASPLQQPGLGV